MADGGRLVTTMKKPLSQLSDVWVPQCGARMDKCELLELDKLQDTLRKADPQLCQDIRDYLSYPSIASLLEREL